MSLVRGDILQIWNYEPLGGIRHPRNIENIWSKEDLSAVGLHRIIPFVLPAGKRKISGPSYTIVDDMAVESYVIEDIPPLTPDEIEADRESQTPTEAEPIFRALLDLENRLRQQEQVPLLTPSEVRARIKGFYDALPASPPPDTFKRRFVARTLAADEVNSTNVLANVGLLGFVVAAGETAYFEFDAIFRTAATQTGVAFAVSGPANSSIVCERNIPTSGAAAANVINTQQASGDDATNTATTSIDAANTDRLANVRGIVRAGPNPGDGGLVRLRFRSEVNNSAVTVRGGSFVRAWFDEPPSP